MAVFRVISCQETSGLPLAKQHEPRQWRRRQYPKARTTHATPARLVQVEVVPCADTSRRADAQPVGEVLRFVM